MFRWNLFHFIVEFRPPFPEKIIQGVVKQLGQKSINMEALSPSDLDQLSEVITQALQVVDDVEGVKGREVVVDDESEMKREPGPQGQLGKLSGEEFTPKGTSLCFWLQ